MREKLFVFEMNVELTCVSSPNCEFVEYHLAESVEVATHISQRFQFAEAHRATVEAVRTSGGLGVEKYVKRRNQAQDRVEPTAVVFVEHTKKEFLSEVPSFGLTAPFGFHLEFG